jgi:acyl-CoA synthetase (AMP-forming)/AMP-acid ligase II
LQRPVIPTAMYQSPVEFVYAHASSHPERTAIASERTRLTYSELAGRVNSAAQFLLDEGVRPGDCVAALVGPGCEGFTLFLAVNAVGAVWLGLNPRYKYREMEYVMKDSGARFLFFAPEFRGRQYDNEVAQLLRECASIEKAYSMGEGGRLGRSVASTISTPTSASGDVLRSVLACEDRSSLTAMLVYTSGSSGAPKGVLIPNRSMVRRSLNQISQLPMDDYPRVYNAYPMNHVGGVHWVSCYAMVAGGTVHFRENFDPAEVPDLIVSEDINVLQFFPAMYQLLIDSPAYASAKFRGVKWHFFSGAAISENLLSHVRSWGGQIITSYGMSETCGSVTYGGPELPDEILADTIGKPVPPGEVRVVSNSGHNCREGETGEMQVRAEFGMSGYLNRPEQTKNAFTEDGWLNTGDLVLVLAGGNLKFVGRLSEMFKSGGFNVYPREIELVLEAHPDVSLAAVVAQPHRVFGEVGAAFVVPKPGASLNLEALRAWCLENLADFKVPKNFTVRTQLPMLPIGKVDKVALKDELAAGRAAAVSVPAVST